MKPYSRFNQESTLHFLSRKVFEFVHRVVRGLANNMLSKDCIRPREFSNSILRYYAPLFDGKIINVSGWKDGDFENGFYATYFGNATSYHISNAPTTSKGLGSVQDEIGIDLSKPIDQSLKQKFDVVFNHTTLEHIFELETAFKNLCDLSREVVILVVPTLQQIHFNKGYGDYNRLTPLGIVKYFEQNNFETLVLQSNEQQFSPIYCFVIAARSGSKYIKMIEKNLEFSMGGELYGSKINTTFLGEHIHLNT